MVRILKFSENPRTNKLLRSPQAEKRVLGLEKIAGKGSVDSYLYFIADRSKVVRAAAVRGLQTLEEDGIPTLLKLIGAGKSDVVDEAIDCLVELSIDYEDLVTTTLKDKLLLDDDPYASENITTALMYLSPSDLLPVHFFIPYIDHESPTIRVNALSSIESYGLSAAIHIHEILDVLTQYDDEPTLVAAINLLGVVMSEEMSDEVLAELGGPKFTGDDDSYVTLAAEKTTQSIKKFRSSPVVRAKMAAREIRRYIVNNGTDEFSVRKCARLIQEKTGIARNIYCCQNALLKLREAALAKPEIIGKEFKEAIKSIDDALRVYDTL